MLFLLAESLELQRHHLSYAIAFLELMQFLSLLKKVDSVTRIFILNYILYLFMRASQHSLRTMVRKYISGPFEQPEQDSNLGPLRIMGMPSLNYRHTEELDRSAMTTGIQNGVIISKFQAIKKLLLFEAFQAAF